MLLHGCQARAMLEPKRGDQDGVSAMVGVALSIAGQHVDRRGAESVGGTPANLLKVPANFAGMANFAGKTASDACP